MTAKQRLRQFIENQSLTTNKFCKKNLLSNSFFNNESSIGSDKLLKIFSNYPELNMDWVITGRGEMTYKSKTNNMDNNEVVIHYGQTLKDIIRFNSMGDEDIANNIGVNVKELQTEYKKAEMNPKFLGQLAHGTGINLFKIFSKINSEYEKERYKAALIYIAENNILITDSWETVPPSGFDYNIDFLEEIVKAHKHKKKKESKPYDVIENDKVLKAAEPEIKLLKEEITKTKKK